MTLSLPETRAQTRTQARATLMERKRRRKAGEVLNVVASVSFKFATQVKRAALFALLREIRGCVNRYIRVCWKNSNAALDTKTLNLVSGGSLSYRHRSNALKIALEMCSSTKKSADALCVRPSRPHFRNNAAVPLSKLVASIEKGNGSFDYFVKIAGLVKGHPILLPVKSHNQLNDWLKQGKLLDSIVVTENTAHLQVEVELPPMRKPSPNTTIGIDLGYLKLLATNEGIFHGRKMKTVTDRVRRSKPGSKGKLRARRARTHYINRQINELPWDRISAIGVEELAGIKSGKGQKGSPKFYKNFRKKMAPWVHRQATSRIEFKALVNRVHLVTVDPRNTSRTCPSCGKVAKENRRGEVFRCIRCNYTTDADHVGGLITAARAKRTLAGVYGACVFSDS
jgi:transposase